MREAACASYLTIARRASAFTSFKSSVFGEPANRWGQKVVGPLPFAPIALERCHTNSCPQFPGLLSLLTCNQRGKTMRGQTRSPIWPRDLLRLFLREKLLAVGKAVRLEEEAENDGPVGRHRFVLVAGWTPNKLTRSAYPFVILKGAFEHEGLLQRGVLMERYDGARIKLEQSCRDATVVGIEHLDLDAVELGLLPRHVGHVEIVRGKLRRVVGFDIGMHDFAGLR